MKLRHLPQDKANDLSQLILELKDVALLLQDLRTALVPVEHLFELSDDTPIYYRCSRIPPKPNGIIKKELGMMLEAGSITPDSSAWSFLVVIATKKDGKPRLWVDYRKLNQRMKPNQLLPLMILEIFNELARIVFFSTLDFFSGYWHVRMSGRCKEMTVFPCRFGTYMFEGIPFGLMNIPSTFQRMMDSSLGDLPFVKVHLDEVVFFSGSFDEHVAHMKNVLRLVSRYGMELKI